MRRKKRISIVRAFARVLSLALCVALCLSVLPAHSLSVGESSRLCGHVCEDGTCAYSAGAPCAHRHDESCYQLTHRCAHVCSEACADPCDHVCGAECYEKELHCTHVHDEACGYAAPSEGGCDHICHVVGFDGYAPGTPIVTYPAPEGASYADILAALPATLPGRLACAAGAFDIPVAWSCAAFAGESGVYTFRAALTDAHCDYTVPDDPTTTDVDESTTSPYCDLPTAEVTVTSPAAPAEPPVAPVRGHVCEIASFTDFDPRAVLAVAQFDKGRTVEELYAEVLPQSLAVTYACACADGTTAPPEDADGAQPAATALLPVTWECADFDPASAGDYIFTVKALPAYPFTYLKQDDPKTTDRNEGLLPSVLVRVYEPTAPTEKFAVRYGVLNADLVHVRSGPGTIFESLAQLDADTPVTVTGQCDHWYRVDIAAWTGAFVDKSLVTVLEEQDEAAAPVTGRLNADEVKIRKGPDRAYDAISVLPIGTPMTLLGRCGNWYFVSTEEIEKGYVWNEYVTVDPPAPVAEPECTCTEHCAEGHVNEDCPVCAAHPDDCAVRYIAEGYPRTGRVNAENCEVRVGANTLHLHSDTIVTLYSEADGLYEFSSDEIEKGFIAGEYVTVVAYECTCTVPCTETTCNQLCPVCAAEGWGACAIKELSKQTITAEAEDGSAISISGRLPVGATASVTVVPLETAAEFVADGAEILFAYDIKILVAGVEWQPDESVRVSLTPPPETPIVADVAVTHVSEDKDTGAVTTSTIADVSTTLSDETTAQPAKVEFAAEGFSVYIGTIYSGTPPTLTLTPGTGYQFYSDATCTQPISAAEYSMENTSADGYIYALESASYTIVGISYTDVETGIETIYAGTVAAPNVVKNTSTGVWTLKFPLGMTSDQIIKVIMSDSAPGGTITTSSTAAAVAAMFDATAAPDQSETANVSVTESGGTFTVDIKNDILLQGTVTVASGASVTLTTSGDVTVKRDVASCNGSMFQVEGTLSLGAGTEGASSITYSFSGAHPQQTLTLPHTIPTVGDDIITETRVNEDYRATMTGTLTIDGGANFTVPVDAASKTYPVPSAASTGSIINSAGTLKLWDGVTLQNNYNAISNDGLTYAGVRIERGSFYMFGGKITQCSTRRSNSMSDGGGICFLDGNAYFFGGEITECCADNGAAVAIFGSGTHPTAYYLGTYIHHNLAGGDHSFPGQACSAYDGAALRMYDGSIVDNKNVFLTGDADADYDMKPSGDNSGVNLFGGAIGKLGVVPGSIVNVYNCVITTIQGAGTVNYIVGYSVIIPDCVALNTTDAVRIKVEKFASGAYTDYITVDTAGDGTSTDLVLTLLPGEYRITVDTASMQKEYTVTVTVRIDNTSVTATPTSRTIMVPVVKSRTSNSITITPVGNDNPAANGAVLYGYSSTSNANGVPTSGPGAWQSISTFDTSGLSGSVYFFVKAMKPSPDPYSFNESISPALSVDFNGIPSVDIPAGCDVPMNVGGVRTIPITTTPPNYDVGRILWTVSGAAHVGTGITINQKGYGYLQIAANEHASAVTVRVELRDKDNVFVTSDTITIPINPSAQIESAGFEVPSVLSAVLVNVGTVTAGSYQWYRNGVAIEGETRSTYTTTATDANRAIQVAIIGSDSTVYTSPRITISAPQLSVTVPTSMTVTVNGAGQCTAEIGSIVNDSTVPVYVTNVSYAWDTEGDPDADELFHDHTAVTAALTLDEKEYSFRGAESTPVSPNTAIAAKSGATPGTLPLPWAFTLGTGNYINLVSAIGEGVHVATVTYTIDYTRPTP